MSEDILYSALYPKYNDEHISNVRNILEGQVESLLGVLISDTNVALIIVLSRVGGRLDEINGFEIG
jgi:hypothetical protein